MCGIAGIFGKGYKLEKVESMTRLQHHRGPDGSGTFVSAGGRAGLGHNRLSIIDLSSAGDQPMASSDGRFTLILNGEIYNYLELRGELDGKYPFRSKSDTEVLLAAYTRWGTNCLDRLVGMFAFVIWDEVDQTAFVARDRFGVKPLYYHQGVDGTLSISSEIKALHGAGVLPVANEKIWSTYLSHGFQDHSIDTFWKDVYSLPGGHYLTWKNDRTVITKWYDIADRLGGDYYARSETDAQDEYYELMKQSVKLRFRSDVPIGINLSGGLDSSTLLGLVHANEGDGSEVKAFTFITGDDSYDELPWVKQMLARTKHPLVISKLTAEEVPALAESVQYHQDEPFGGLPTLAYAKLFEKVREHGVTVVLDGNGMDEQWAGYDYYQSQVNGGQPSLVQGTREQPVRPECLDPGFRALAEPMEFPTVFPDKLRNLQYRDTKFTKIPRVMRFNDRISMRSSTELREPFLDHRMFELALRQPADRKIRDGIGKRMLRDIAARFVPANLSEAPKRPLQTPQREWLRGRLRDWAYDTINVALSGTLGSFLNKKMVLDSAEAYFRGESDNSFYIWQWISLGMATDAPIRSPRSFNANNAKSR